MAGTASSLAGTFRFGIGAIIGALLSLATFNSHLANDSLHWAVRQLLTLFPALRQPSTKMRVVQTF